MNSSLTKIALFGASGATGRQVITQALEKDIAVKALVRDPQKLAVKHEKLEIIKGNVLDPVVVEKVIEGTTAVIVTLGSRPDTKSTVLGEGTNLIVNAMQTLGTKRLIIMSSYSMSGAPESMEFLQKVMPPEKIAQVQPYLDDKIGQEKVTRESGIDWTIVRPMSLTDGPETGTYRVGEKLEVKPGDTISRADVADFLLKIIDDSTWSGKIVTLSY